MAIYSDVKEYLGFVVSFHLLLFLIFLNANLLEACRLLFRSCLLGLSLNFSVFNDLLSLGLGALNTILFPLELLSGVLQALVDVLVVRILLQDELEVADG